MSRIELNTGIKGSHADRISGQPDVGFSEKKQEIELCLHLPFGNVNNQNQYVFLSQNIYWHFIWSDSRTHPLNKSRKLLLRSHKKIIIKAFLIPPMRAYRKQIMKNFKIMKTLREETMKILWTNYNIFKQTMKRSHKLWKLLSNNLWKPKSKHQNLPKTKHENLLKTCKTS